MPLSKEEYKEISKKVFDYIVNDHLACFCAICAQTKIMEIFEEYKEEEENKEEEKRDEKNPNH